MYNNGSGVSTASKTPLRTRGRVDGLQRVPIDIDLIDGGFTATSTLEATCTGNTAALKLDVTDAGEELQKSSITVGSGGGGCTAEETGATVNLDLGINECGRSVAVEAVRTVYTWAVRVDHFPEPVNGVVFTPLSSTHVVTCAVAISDPPAVTGEQPAPVTGDEVEENSAAIQLRLTKEDSSTNRLWQLTVAPTEPTAVPAGLSYRLATCTATPAGEATPSLVLIANGCVTPKTGTSATYTASTKQYALTVRAFGFSGVDGNIQIQCTAVLCQPDGTTGLCAEQSESPFGLCPVNGGETPDETGRALFGKALSQLPNKLVRRVRSATQYITSNVLAL